MAVSSSQESEPAVGTSIQMNREAQETERKRYLQELHIFHDVAKAITSSLNLDSILQTIMDKMAEYFRPDTWSLLMVDEASDELYFAIAVGSVSESLRAVRLKLGEGVAGWVARHGEPLIVPDAENDPRFAKRIDEITQWKTRSILCLPLKSKQRVLGVIQLINVPMEAFGDEQIFFLQSLCDYAAIAIDNARSMARIEELSITDDCTGLYNARHLYNCIDSEVSRSQRFGYEFTVLFVDLDHFKVVNDTHGHLYGSHLLQEVGRKLKSNLRFIDLAFRYGGDEFVVLLPQTPRDQGILVAQRLLDMFRTTTFLTQHRLDLNVRASIGVATFPQDGIDGREIIRQSDEAMYMVKNTTRDAIGIAGEGRIESP